METSSVDPEEIAKFNRLAAEWWNTQGACAPLHQLNPVRLAFIQQQVKLTGKQVLDVGCGGGILTESLARQQPLSVTGLDQAADLIQVAQQHAQQQNLPLVIDYRCENTEDFALAHAEKFDVITCMEMLEHVPEPAMIIQACAKLLKPGGKIFFSTLHRTWKAYLAAIIAAEYLLKWLPIGTHDYQRFIRPSELAQAARDANLTPRIIRGISWHPLSREYTLSEDVSVNYLMMCEKDE